MKLSATAVYRPRGDMGRFVESRVSPAVRASVEAATKLIEDRAKSLCPVRTGALRDSITSEVFDTGKTVVGRVAPSAPYAGYVEFGTGIAGAASPGSGKGPYNMAWPGMVAQPFMRTAVDESKGPVLELFRSNVATVVHS